MSLPAHPLVQPFFHGESSTWSYVVADVSSARAAVIDPVLDFDPKSARTSTHSVDSLIAWVCENAFAIDWILETHAHADHLSAAQHVKQQLGGRIGIGAGICATQKTFAPIFGLEDAFACDGSQFDRLFADEESFPVGDIDAQVIAVPGHMEYATIKAVVAPLPARAASARRSATTSTCARAAKNRSSYACAANATPPSRVPHCCCRRSR